MVRFRQVFAGVVFWGCLVGFGTQLSASSQTYIVKFKSPQTASKLASWLSKSGAGVRVKETHRPGNLALVAFPQTKTNEDEISAFKKLRQDPAVEYVVPNIKMKAFETKPNDTDYPKQWALQKIHAEKAWDLGQGSSRVVVAVIDTGMATDHMDLQANLWKNTREIPANGKDDDGNGYVDDVNGWDFHENDNNPMDATSDKNPGHGTHCAGIVGAVGNNQTGIVGASWQVKLMPIRFLGADGSGDLMNAVKAIDYAAANHAQVISASWGAAVSRDGAKPILEAIERLESQNILFLAAAANDGQSNDTSEVYPANAGYSHVISVAASDPEDAKPSWSNFGQEKVDLASPGLNIYSTLPGNKYGNLSGTSMATPLAAGVAALVIAQAELAGRTLKPQEIKAILQSTAETVSIETACHCRIAADRAVEAVRNEEMVVVPFAKTIDIGEKQVFSAIGGVGPYTFESSDSNIASFDEAGTLVAKQGGKVAVTVHDTKGHSVASGDIFVGKSAQPPEERGECPVQDPMLCLLLCVLDPTQPWCPEMPGREGY